MPIGAREKGLRRRAERKAKDARIYGDFLGYMRREISVYAEIFFRIYRNLFSYIRKFLCAYTEVSLRIKGALTRA